MDVGNSQVNKIGVLRRSYLLHKFGVKHHNPVKEQKAFMYYKS